MRGNGTRTLAPLVAIVLAGAAQAGLADVPSVVAEEWLVVTKEPETHEGLIFDRDGNLYMVLVGNARSQIRSPVQDGEHHLRGVQEPSPTVKIEKDGRLSLFDLGEEQGDRGDRMGRIVQCGPTAPTWR